MAVETYFQSHHTFSAVSLAEGEERLRTFNMGMQVLEHLAEEMHGGITDALSDAH
jgi:hypothetical protein